MSNVEAIRNIIRSVYSLVRFYEIIVKNKEPSRIYIEDIDSINNLALVYVAKRLNIPTVEVQHGMIARGHFGYTSYVNIFPNPYPSFFFSFGERYARYISEEIYRPHNIVCVGSYYIEYIKKNRDKVLDIVNEKYCFKDKKVIAVASQETVDLDLVTFFSQFAKDYKEWFVIFVPRVFHTYEGIDIPDNMSVEYDLDIYQCISCANVTATVSSTCCFESLALGKPVLLVNIRNTAVNDLAEALDSKTTMRVVDSYDEVDECLKELMQEKPEEIENESIQYYQSGYNENIVHAIGCITNSYKSE